MRKGIHSKVNETQGILYRAFKLDHLQPVKLILFHTFSTCLIFILGSPIPYYPREGGWK